jgi:Protein of unknown function (DUF551)
MTDPLLSGTNATRPTDGQSECSPWIDANERLPGYSDLVVAYLAGTKDHSDARWTRNGFAFIVRHNSREHVVSSDQWSSWHYNEALRRLDADELTVTHWMPLERPS